MTGIPSELEERIKANYLPHDDDLREPDNIVPPDYTEVNLVLNDREIKMSVEWLLRMETDAGEVTDVGLEVKLGRIAYNALVFLQVQHEVALKRKMTERAFKEWLAGVNHSVRASIIEDRVAEKKEKGVPASWFGSITKLDIEEAILRDPRYSIIYKDYQNTLAEQERYEKICEGLVKIILAHGENIKSILYRRSGKNSRDTYLNQS